ncbi:general secretion pathway protein GspL [Luteimonas weifangensis]|uniref:General secretion pathway protein GspL n=1 Tax=Cognatiluteimonas weifangensis TaxID=2303539 RepID=A0A372DLY3_9GAMM|nr:general secretion pathway protein GspL [Luteimonas weifangensis]
MSAPVGSLLRDRLGRHAARWAGVGGFFAWWGRALAAWLPRRWRRALGLERGRLLLQPADDAVQLRLHDGDGVRDLARVPELAAASADALAALLSPELAELPRWLLLPAASGLRRRLSLPAAAAERLRDVVGFEIDRQTPFAAEAVAFDARLLGRRDGDGQLDAELVVVPRATLAAQSTALGALAESLAGVDIAGDDGVPLGVNLLPPAQRRQQRDPWRGWNRVLAAVAVFAFVALLAQLLDNRERAVQTLQARVEREAVAARAVALQRQQLTDLIEGRAFLERQRSSRPTAVEVLDELARRLPDNTYLEKLAIENDRLLLIGLSGEASALVGRLQGAAPWRSPALTGALQPDPRSGRDRFTLTAELAVAPAAAAAVAPESADAGRR